MNYTLWQGDCLSILPTLEVWVVAPFTADMTSMTKANEVTKVIGLLGDCEVCKPNNVMYIKLLAVFCLCYAALLAGVIVPLTSAATLTLPVCAIVALVIAALPVVVVCAAMPLVSAIGTTEAETARTFECSGDSNMSAALFAIVFVGWFSGRLWRYQTLTPSFLVALLRTNCDQLGAGLKGLALKFSQANLASVAVVILLNFAAQFIRAFAATSGLPPMLEALRISEIITVAVGASSFNHGHIIA